MFQYASNLPHPEEARSAVSKDGERPGGASFETGLQALLRMRRSCEGTQHA